MAGLGALVGQLLEDGRALVRAEVALAKATASQRAAAVKAPAVLLIVALFLLQAGLTVLLGGLGMGLGHWIGPALGVTLAGVLGLAIAGLLAWIASKALGGVTAPLPDFSGGAVMSGVDPVSRAEAGVRDARGRFEATLATLQRRLKPARVAREAWDGAREKGTELAQDAAEVVRKRPALVGLTAAGIAAFFARGRIVRGAKRLFHKDDEPAAAPAERSRRRKR